MVLGPAGPKIMQHKPQCISIPLSLSGSLAVLNSGFWIPGRARKPPNLIRYGRNRAPWARGELGFSQGMSTTWSPDWQAEVGDHFGHPPGAQVKGLNSEF